jgi:hypothetical protein
MRSPQVLAVSFIFTSVQCRLGSGALRIEQAVACNQPADRRALAFKPKGRPFSACPVRKNDLLASWSVIKQDRHLFVHSCMTLPS